MTGKIIVYRWNSNSEEVLVQTMKRLGIEVAEITRQIRDYHADAAFAGELIEKIHKEKPVAVFSYNYFPIISSVCEINGLPYLCWIYDCPLYTLNSVTIRNHCNYIFCFDRNYAGRLVGRGAQNCFHMPLGVDVQDFEKLINEYASKEGKDYGGDVSFVGSLYNGTENRLRTRMIGEGAEEYLSERMQDKGNESLAKETVTDKGAEEFQQSDLEKLLADCKGVNGSNGLKRRLPKAAVEVIVEGCELALGKMYEYTKEELAAAAVNIEITAREREEVLLTAAEISKVELYTGSQLQGELVNHANIKHRGYADNKKEMPLIFSRSKINLNITSKSIESGIPLRVLEVLACGGFCITNYQLEVAEFLLDGEEIVMYTNLQDLREKLRYYLEHEEERAQIALNGQKAVRERFSLEERIRDMLTVIGVQL